MYCFKKLILICIIVLLNLFPNKIRCQDVVQYNYQIEVPKYTCDKKDSLKNGTTTIRLMGEDALKLEYEWTVYFKSISDTCKQKQRCTLMAWKAVRDLEKHLQRMSTSQRKSEKINIDTEMLLPEIQYVLNVTVKGNGTKVDSKQFLLMCTNETSDENETHSNQKHSEVVSIVLLGSNVTYRDMVYILNAETDFNYSYYFQWEIINSANKLIIRESTKRSNLLLFGDLLNATQKYVIRCNLVCPHRNISVTAVQNVKVLKRGVVLKLSVATLVVGPQKPFKLSAYLEDVDDLNEPVKIEWYCTAFNPRFCSNFKSVNSTVVECNGFPVVGRYNITISVTKGDDTETASCEILVVKDGFVRIDVDEIRESLDPKQEIEIPVEISGLISGCMLQWSSIQANNYKYADLNVIPGNLNLLTNVTFKEDEFLNEIDEYTNNTIDTNFDLTIPAPKDKWTGLTGGSSYLFRINATCSVSWHDFDSNESEEPLLEQKSVTLYADVVVKTGAPPELSPFEVIPAEGEALKTIFEFRIREINNTNADYPILYKFGYFLNGQIIFVASLLDILNTKSTLPFVEKGVRTVLEGCNSHSMCSQILGPIVITKISSLPAEYQDFSNFMHHLSQLMGCEEYYKAFTYSLAVIHTCNSIPNRSLSHQIQDYISNVTINETRRLLVQSSNDDKNWRLLAVDFITNMQLVLPHISVKDELINNMVKLRNKISDSKNSKLDDFWDTNRRKSTRKLLQVTKRFKRQTDLTTLEEVKNYFIISELIITTSPDKSKVRQEKQNLLEQIDTFLQGLCKTLHEKPQVMRLELKTVILILEKLTKTIVNKYIHILYTENSWKVNGRLKLGKCLIEKLKYNNRLCVGKVAFKNYLNKKGIIFMTKIYSAEQEDQEYLDDLACDSIFVLPVNEKQIEGRQAKCALWKNQWLQDPCRTLQSSNRTVQCACNNLGYYTLEYNPLPTILVATSTSSTLTTSSSSAAPTKNHTFIDGSIKSSSGMIPKLESSTKSYLDDETTINSSLKMHTMVYDNELSKTTEDGVLDDEVYSTVKEISDNISLATFYTSKADKDEIVLYFLIGFSLAGIGVLLYGIKRILSHAENTFPDNFHIYAPLYHEEMLQDVSPEGDT